MNGLTADKKNNNTDSLATAALILGVLAALGLIFVIPPFLFGATAIVLGLLSGGRDGLSVRAKIGMFMGAFSMVLLVVIMVSAVKLLMDNPDIMRHFYDSFYEIYNELEDQGIPVNSFT